MGLGVAEALEKLAAAPASATAPLPEDPATKDWMKSLLFPKSVSPSVMSCRNRMGCACESAAAGRRITVPVGSCKMDWWVGGWVGGWSGVVWVIGVGGSGRLVRSMTACTYVIQASCLMAITSHKHPHHHPHSHSPHHHHQHDRNHGNSHRNRQPHHQRKQHGMGCCDR